jgi:hypothetical protein
LQVLGYASEIASVPTSGGAGVGIGFLPDLEAVPTPTAAKAGTRSPYKVLWRHLEFGTGAYRTDPAVNAGSPHRLPSGGWWFGRSEGYALHLKGSKPVSALRDPKTKLAYSGDAMRFQGVFQHLMREALGVPTRGRRGD